MAASRQAITVDGDVRAVHGFLYGLRQPAIALSVRVRYDGDVESCLARVDEELRAVFPHERQPRSFSEAGPEGLPLRLLYWTGVMQRRAGLGVFEEGKVLAAGEGGQGRFRLLAPAMPRTQANAVQALQWLLWLLNHAWDGRPTTKLREGLPGIWRVLGEAASGSRNTVPFLEAAHRLHIPVSHVAGNTYQFGYGARARWMNSSFTDRTPQVSAVLARNKHLTAMTLRRAGLPAPVHAVVGDRARAVAAAEKLGYPVAVKPLDKDGGVGVAAGLRDGASVEKAFDRARKISANILVERHVAGRDYRLTVLDGELIWAIERVPAGVTGDGERTVAELIEQSNADPRRGKAAHFPLSPIRVDEEANEFLAEQSLSLRDVPETGRFVRLHRTANITNGGMPVGVLERVHPDNRRLAECAAAALRLDMAGVDLLIPDIARSWRHTGGVVCEVNAQPNIGRITASHLYEPILRRLVDGEGRIPIAVIVGSEKAESACAAAAEAFERQGLCVGRFERGRVLVGEERVAEGVENVFAAGEMLLADTDVEAIVFHADGGDVLRTGLAFDAFDTLIVAADAADAVVEALKPACRSLTAA